MKDGGISRPCLGQPSPITIVIRRSAPSNTLPTSYTFEFSSPISHIAHYNYSDPSLKQILFHYNNTIIYFNRTNVPQQN